MFSKSKLSEYQLYYHHLVKDYIKSFKDNSKDNETLLNIELKEEHSFNVADNCINIAKSEKLKKNYELIAYLCGLFHDIGRFEQFTKYKTFKDNESLYHGKLGVDIIKKENFLKNLDISYQKIINSAVYNHGLLTIPENTCGDDLFFSKLIRDADKIDIFRIVAKYYNTDGPRNISLEYGLNNEEKFSEKVIRDFKSLKLISKLELETLNDFKLMQISWVFDLHFAYSKQVIRENKFLEIILNSMNCNLNNKNLINSIIKKY